MLQYPFGQQGGHQQYGQAPRRRGFNIGSLRWLILLGFVACASLIGYALYVQFVQQLMPCPFCIFQRICFAVLGLVFLFGALHAPRAAGPRRAWGLAALAAAAVPSRELLSSTTMSAPGRCLAKSPTTLATVAASL